MAIAFDATYNGNAIATSLTYAHTCTGSNLRLYVAIGDNTSDAADVITGVTYNTVAMTRDAAMTNGGGTHTPPAFLYSLNAPATGSNNVVVSASGTINISARSVSYTGVSQVVASDAKDSGYNNNAKNILWTITGTSGFTTVADNCWIISAATGWNEVPVTSSLGTSRGTGPATKDNNAPFSPAGSQTINWTTTNNDWDAGVIASFAPSATATTVTPNPQLLLMGVG